ncbi:lysophospholipid acyltransferase family protein [Marinomonas sp. IMCC 4694]|uniref:lysophospholipid acyltransferase family protein n=1 Tax=Marinomonas sp. IMCC 4694 TaxID=2605432 RepID=UPI0011E80049|nr:lipid A biosynthesis acyltransferase [Marinomonas sp. IMCC 4694]TYL48304.1 lipid A biosynthesis acyltransferase [Marinomonas sp. IMCC 4694]
MAKTTLNKNITHFLKPKHWPTWFAMGIAYGLSFLPWALQQRMGKYLGRLLYRLTARRRHICDVNLNICYPKMTKEERKNLTKAHFESMGKGVFEMFSTWFQDRNKTASKVRFHNQDVVEKALAKGNGCIIVGAHFSSIDMCGTHMARFIDVHPIYKLQRNPVMNWIMERQRQAIFSKTIERSNVREVLKSLKQNKAVWYAVDQDYGRRNSVFAPFFGRQCATISHVSRLAKNTNAAILLYDYGRTDNGYFLSLTALENYPTGDEIQDATLINQLIEKQINTKKEQYFWSHRRFKTQENDNAPSPYDR